MQIPPIISVEHKLEDGTIVDDLRPEFHLFLLRLSSQLIVSILVFLSIRFKNA